jgi:hypothetical protein
MSPIPKARGKVCDLAYATVRRRIGQAATTAGVSVPHDAGRHAFASYHLVINQDAARTSLQLGHSRPDLLFTKYRGLVTKKKASALWRIHPPSTKQNVVKFPTEAA